MIKKIAIIPAKNKSKRLANKNIKLFFGKPMIYYTIEAAKKSKLFDEIIVSTDSDKIENLSSKYNVSVHRRKGKLLNKNAQVKDVCLSILEKKKYSKVNIFACLYATSPLRSFIDIKKTYKLLDKKNCNFAMSITKNPFPAFQSLKRSKNNLLIPKWPKLINLRTEDVEELFIDNGSTYFCHADKFKKFKSFYGPKLKGYLMPYSKSIDIDTIDDFNIAKYFYKK